MQNEAKITCPKCQHSFKLEEIYRQEIEQKIIANYEADKNKAIIEAQQKVRKEEQSKFDVEREKLMKSNNEMTKQVAELQQVSREKNELELQIAALKNANKKIQSDLDIEIQKAIFKRENEFQKEKENAINEWKKMFEDKQKNSELQVRMELEEKINLQKQNELDRINLQKQNEINKIKTELELKHKLELKEKDEKLLQANKRAEELTKNLNQNSMQIQGEAQEKLLSERLKEMFIYDDFSAKTTGKEESDIEQIIKYKDKICGKILYESKNTKAFNPDWIPKLKKDGQKAKADFLVLITQAMPSNNNKLHKTEGIWICPIDDFEIVARTLRYGLVKISEQKIINENKHDKMIQLYDFMNGKEFQNYMEAVFMGIKKLKESYDEEKNALRKIWARRDKEFVDIYENSTNFFGAIKGIAGIDTDLFELPGQQKMLE